jgi:CHAT domain-containing protein/tetratricopeptide (TPR) repeat protein
MELDPDAAFGGRGAPLASGGLDAMRILRILGLGLLLTMPQCTPARLGKAGTPRPQTGEVAGVVVESVRLHFAGATAGLQPGDVILSWSCEASPPTFPQPSSGSVRSPYDLVPLEVEEAPRRAVTLRGKRGNEERTWTLTEAEWGIDVRPAVEPGRTTGDGHLAAWFLGRRAGELAAAGKWPEADAVYQQELTVLESVPDPQAAAHFLRGWGETFQRRGALDAAAERYEKALALDRATAPKSLAAARTLDLLGVLASRRGDYGAGGQLLREAWEIREELAPGTTEVAWSLNRMGVLARLRGDLDAAEQYLVRSEELERRLAPGSARHALVFLNLGNLAGDRGDLEKAEGWLRRALPILEESDPGGASVAGCLHNLAGVAAERGDLATADDLLRRILAIQERGTSDELGASRALMSLGDLALRRSDLEAAEGYHRRALALVEKLAPGGRETAFVLTRLGELALLRGDFATARTYLRRAQEIEEKVAPGSLRAAEGLESLARLEIDSGGDLAAAEASLRRALAVYEQRAPESLEASGLLRDLGEIAVRRGRLQEAQALHRRALVLQSRLAPGSSGEAEMLHLLGRAERRAGRTREGVRDLCRAIDVLDRQRARLGGTPEAKTSFEATLEDSYHACLEGLVDLGRPGEAFHVLERGRARSFLALLAERDLRLSDLPPELAAERRRANAEYDRVQAELAPLSAGRDSTEIERLTGELRDLRTRQEGILARMRRESPRAAALQDPVPLDLAGARAALDPGTVLLEYAVGRQKSWLFVVQPAGAKGSGLSVLPLAIGAESLRAEVESFRLLVKDPGSDLADLRARARRLYSLLVRPAERQIAGAERILFSPDGPLHTLPFAALMRRDEPLIRWKPIHSVLSATVYAELTRSRPPRRDPGEDRLAAFGDPTYPSQPSAPVDPEVREAVRRGLVLTPLPFSSREVRDIAALYPRAQVYLGREATEERAKAIAPESRLLHFACHGVLDERFPLNSALALTLPEQPSEGRGNGLLQAWEIFESVRLDADLVTLSACDTALGREMAGEGLVGLTRAFQYAGARSVLASLWGVSDRSTALLMKRFYENLRSGKPKDEALRAAQIDQIRGSEFSHPFHWAAFQLTGDWR